MSPFLLEWLNIMGRWVHVIAAIMWIGDSFLFTWMDRSLMPPSRRREGAVAGELWMVHSGGFYEVVKRRYLAPDELPSVLHWFMWEAFTTWISGFFLLVVIYYLGATSYLVDRNVLALSGGAAVLLSLGVLAAGNLLYEALWSSPLARRPARAAWISFALVVGAAYGLSHLFGGRGAYLHLGALLGTIMASNVARHIIPAQRRMLAATRAGREVDVREGERAKQRSIHNHYMTLPVLFTMLSNHFPSTYGHPHSWVVLSLIVVVGVVAKHVMNERGRSHRWALAAGGASLMAVVALTAVGPAPAALPDLSGEPPVSFSEVRTIVEQRCITCHAARPTNPSFPQPPNGVTFEDPRDLRAQADRILVRVVATRTMPLGNVTGMTEAERRRLGAWIVQGARLDAGR